MSINGLIAVCFLLAVTKGGVIYVDKGIPYDDGKLSSAELTIEVTTDASPKHVKVYFPLGPGEFPVIYFIGGLSAYVPAEAYSIVLSKVAKHGFFVLGIDYGYPVSAALGEDLDLQKYLVNKTSGIPRWDLTGLACHSAGCDTALKMLEMQKFPFKASAFMEPYSQLVHGTKLMNYTVPSLMYGTQLSEDGFPHCNVRGYDYIQFYNVWKCPKVALEVADFGHCDFLDPVAWEGCHITHFCKTTNNTRLDHYRQTVQGVISAFFETTLQGRHDVIDYITNTTKIPTKVLVSKSDWTC